MDKSVIEICQECNYTINCVQHNIFIVQKEEDEKIWCQSCFEDLWKDYSKNGWSGDDINYYLELEQYAKSEELEQPKQKEEQVKKNEDTQVKQID
jgi:hypothetical protein